MHNPTPWRQLLQAILSNDPRSARQLLAAAPELAHHRTRAYHFFPQIAHNSYARDTPLHLAAAAYRTQIVQALLAHGADPHAQNRLGTQPLHYAADGNPGLPHWNPRRQQAVIRPLVQAGADPNAKNKLGVAPLHRAARTRATPAVQALLACGASATLKNKSGTTPLQLARQTTGHGGTGTPAAKTQQQAIIKLLTHP